MSGAIYFATHDCVQELLKECNGHGAALNLRNTARTAVDLHLLGAAKELFDGSWHCCGDQVISCVGALRRSISSTVTMLIVVDVQRKGTDENAPPCCPLIGVPCCNNQGAVRGRPWIPAAERFPLTFRALPLVVLPAGYLDAACELGHLFDLEDYQGHAWSTPLLCFVDAAPKRGRDVDVQSSIDVDAETHFITQTSMIKAVCLDAQKEFMWMPLPFVRDGHRNVHPEWCPSDSFLDPYDLSLLTCTCEPDAQGIFSSGNGMTALQQLISRSVPPITNVARNRFPFLEAAVDQFLTVHDGTGVDPDASAPWTMKDDAHLIDAVEHCSAHRLVHADRSDAWSEVAQCFPAHNPTECAIRYVQISQDHVGDGVGSCISSQPPRPDALHNLSDHLAFVISTAGSQKTLSHPSKGQHGKKMDLRKRSVLECDVERLEVAFQQVNHCLTCVNHVQIDEKLNRMLKQI